MRDRFRHALFGLLVGTAAYLLLWVVIPELISFPSHDEGDWFVPLIIIGGGCVSGFAAPDAFGEEFWDNALTHIKISAVLCVTAFLVMLTCDFVYMLLHPDWEGIIATTVIIALFGMPTVKIIEIIIG